MRKLFILEQNIVIRVFPVGLTLMIVGAMTYGITIGSDARSIVQGAAAFTCLISMSMLVGLACALGFFLQGVQRLRFGN